MSEASFESALQELRESAPPAPERLHELVQTLPTAKQRRPVRLRLRPGLVAVVAIAIAVGLGAAVIGGLTNSRKRETSQGATALERLPLAKGARAQAFGSQIVPTPGLTAKSRLQRQDVAMRLRVRDLSGATQSAVRTTRRLGGYVAGADYSTSSDIGNSRLALRVPVTNLQKAIARFTELGTILSQHISVADLQGGLDSLDARIARKQRRVETLHGARREREQRALARLLRSRQALIREGTYARISLQLTTRKAAAKHVEPGRLGRFWVNAGDILGREAIAVLYALVVVGPLVFLAALVFLAERARRRRSDHRLLEETG
jgi:hypothetical protein